MPQPTAVACEAAKGRSQYRFVEVFRGAGGLSAAMVHYRGELVEVLFRNGGPLATANVADEEDFGALLGARADWVN